MANYKQNSYDHRYNTARILLEAGSIKDFEELLTIVPKTIFVTDLGMKGDRFNDCLNDPAHFKLKHIFAMAELLDVDEKILLNMISDHWQATGRSHWT